jgi:hypothetical protein
MRSIDRRGRVIPTFMAFVFAALALIDVATAALPIDACARPSTYPYGPSVAATDAAAFTAYDKNGNAFNVQFWREPCPGAGTNSLLWVRYKCGTHGSDFAMLQDGVTGLVEYDILFNGSCSYDPTPTTFSIEQDSRNTMFRNSGEVTLVYRGAVLSSGTLPAYATSITPAVGLWWNPTESGTGYTIDVHDGVMAVLVYSYKENGDSEWYLAASRLTNNGRSFTATLNKYRGGQCISCTYTGRPTSPGNDGTITITFSSPTAATVQLPGGRVTSIQPELW